MPNPERNKPPTEPLTLREWETLPVGEGGPSEHEADRLHALAERAARRLKLPERAVPTRTCQGLKAGQVVGVLAIPGRSVEILPKIEGKDDAVRKALIHMLTVAHDLPRGRRRARGAGHATTRPSGTRIQLFAERLLAAVRRSLPHRYVAQEDDLRLLRGKLLATRQITHLAARPDRLACRFDELSEDTPLNRLLKAAVARLRRVVRTEANARLLAELAARFEAVGDSPHPLRKPVRLDRTNAAFHALHTLARLFFAGEWQSTASGGALGFALLFPMNDLFERFVGKSLRRALAPRSVRLQPGDHHALIGANGRPLFALRSDATIEAPEGPIVLDTKWKRLAPGEETLGIETLSVETLGVAQSDVYQMLAYARAYGVARLILLYPWTRRWTVAGTGIPLEVATIGVGCPDTAADALRRIVGTARNTARSAPTTERAAA